MLIKSIKLMKLHDFFNSLDWFSNYEIWGDSDWIIFTVTFHNDLKGKEFNEILLKITEMFKEDPSQIEISAKGGYLSIKVRKYINE